MTKNATNTTKSKANYLVSNMLSTLYLKNTRKSMAKIYAQKKDVGRMTKTILIIIAVVCFVIWGGGMLKANGRDKNE